MMPLRVLILDDDKDVANLLATMLEIMGCDCRVTYTPAHALTETEAFRPQLVISDLVMPDMSGFEFVEHVRSMLLERQPFVIAHSGSDGLQDRAASAGFDAYFLKPLLPSNIEFRAIVASLRERQP